MRRAGPKGAALCGALLLAFLAGGPARASAAVPARFFGISPQTPVSARDAAYMRAGGIASVRWPFAWGALEPDEAGGYRWGQIDHLVEVTARHGLTVLPFLAGTPAWLAPTPATLPVASRRQRHAWASFLAAAVRRFGPGGGFWRAHGVGSAEPLPQLPIRKWQIWNEPNFFYFADPISPSRYARLVEISARAIRKVDPAARIILAGLFGEPRQPRRKGLAAPRFLAALYRTKRIKRYFDGIDLHPYAAHVSELEALCQRMRRAARRAGDPKVPLYITEIGWGSEPDPHTVSFEQGPRGQARELRGAYRYLLRDRRRLHLRAAYWFTWKDMAGACSFCDSAGLFHGGAAMRPKRAWTDFVAITGGRPWPSG